MIQQSDKMADFRAAAINNLPDNILLEILSFLSVKDRCISGRVCRRWRKIVQDNSLWRHVDLLPYQLNLRKMWKIIRAHLSDKLRTLKIRGALDQKTKYWSKRPLSESMIEDLKTRCPKLTSLHIESGDISNLPSAHLLPDSLSHLILRKNTWLPRWLRGCSSHFPSLIYLDLSETIRVDNFDLIDIAEFTQLRTLKLDSCYRLKEDGLLKIAIELKGLTFLSLMHCNATDLVIHHISRNLLELQHLDLSFSTSLTQSCLPELVEGLVKLEELHLDGCVNMTSAAFSVLCKSKSLLRVSLVLESSRLVLEDIAPWKKLMPGCHISI